MQRPVRDKRRAPAETAQLTFESVGAAGDGVAHHGGRRVFARLASPGDVAVASITDERAEILEWISRGDTYRAPECPHIEHCGGCALQHLSQPAYSAWKKERVAETLQRAGVQTRLNDPILIAPATRRRATFAARREGKEMTLGFNAPRSTAVADITACSILHPELLAALPRLRSLASAFGGGAFDLSATLCANGLDVNVLGRGLAEPAGGKLADIANAARVCRLSMNGDPLITLVPPRIAFEGISAVPPPGAFLQASAEGEAALLALVRKAIGGARRIADLFCGLGAFALPLSIGARVDAFDSDLPAIHALNEAVKDAQRNGLTLRAGGETRNLFERPLSASEIGKFDAVVFDPPRAGAEAQAAELAKSKIACVIGVSCNPDSFARDAAILSLGGFELVETTPVDQFVYAPHIELVGVFRRR